MKDLASKSKFANDLAAFIKNMQESSYAGNINDHAWSFGGEFENCSCQNCGVKLAATQVTTQEHWNAVKDRIVEVILTRAHEKENFLEEIKSKGLTDTLRRLLPA
jgi:hypothetical protein